MKDEIDRKIAEMLKENARRSNVEMARRIGLTEGAVRARIERMVREGSIRRFTIEQVDTAGAMAVVMIRAKSNTKRAMAEVMRLKLAKELYETTGQFDGCAVVEGADIQEIDLKIDAMRRCKDVANTLTFVVVKKWV